MGFGGTADNENPETTEDKEARLEKMIEKAKQSDLSSRAPIDFYGKILDQNGDPIEGVKVTLKIRDNAWQWETDGQQDTIIELMTDLSGLFSAGGKQGHFLFIEDLEKKGYEYDRAKNPSSFDYQIIENTIEPPFPGDPDNPIVFVLRKRGIVDYLLTETFRLRFFKSQNKLYQPQLLGKWVDAYGKETNLDYRRSESSRCLNISCSWTEDYSEFELHFKCAIEDSGVYLSDQLLYEAPAEGYQQEVIYKNNMFSRIENSGTPGLYNVPLFLYVKGPEKSYYSRIELSISTRPMQDSNPDPLVLVRGHIYTNPAGRRYLDYDETYNAKEGLLRNCIHMKRVLCESNAEREKTTFDETAFREKIDQDRKNYTTEDLITEYDNYIKNSRLNK